MSALAESPFLGAESGGAVCRICLQQTAKTGLGRLLCLDETMKAMAKYLHASDVRHLGQASRGTRISLYTHIGAYARSQGTKIGTLRSLPSQKKTPPSRSRIFLPMPTEPSSFPAVPADMAKRTDAGPAISKSAPSVVINPRLPRPIYSTMWTLGRFPATNVTSVRHASSNVFPAAGGDARTL